MYELYVEKPDLFGFHVNQIFCDFFSRFVKFVTKVCLEYLSQKKIFFAILLCRDDQDSPEIKPTGNNVSESVEC